MFKNFPQKRAVITGGASGLGKAFAANLLADGWTVALADNNATNIATALAEFGHYSNNIFSYQIDVAKFENLQRIAEEFTQKLGGVDVVINCAGIGAGGEFELTSLEDFNTVLDINFKGVLHSCKAFVPVLLKQQSGLIINVASAAGFAAAPKMSSYNVSKAAVISLTETLQAEYEKQGLRFAVITPTFFRSGLHQHLLAKGESRESALRLLTEAKIDAAYVAKKALQQINCGKFYIVLPADAKIVWFFKRHFPNFYLKIVGKVAEWEMMKK